jgi:ribonucleoside-diphosphate reductase alpha chain
LGVPYDSEAALELGEEMMAFINRIGHDESQRMAEVRGPFPNWSKSIYRDGPPMRNATVTTIAPTGTISIIAGCSSGIEPLFALVFDRLGSLDGQLSLEVNPTFGEIARREGFWTEELANAVHERGTARGLPGMPDRWQLVFGTAHDIAPSWHVRMQGAWQKHTDNAVSKTINLPHDAGIEDVVAAYRLAYETGCNGITVYRDGSKVGVLHVGSGSESAPETNSEEPAPGRYGIGKAIASRPHALRGVTYQIETPLGTAYITINHDERGDPLEVFVNQGKAGSDIAPLSEAIGKLSSIILRIPSTMAPRERMEEMISKLRGIGGATSTGLGPERTRSLPDALARVLEEHLVSLDAGDVVPVVAAQSEATAAAPTGNGKALRLSGAFCPDCGMALVHEEGCDKCFTCGYSRC